VRFAVKYGVIVTVRCTTMALHGHVVLVERMDRQRWRVSVDGRRIASYCTESRARAAGKTEARRLEFVALDARHPR
jgi:hypothetical protein